LKTLQASRNSLTQSDQKHSLEIDQVYREKYLQQKARIMEKIKGLDFTYTQTVGKDYQQWLGKY
jgi:hypothetical protein